MKYILDFVCVFFGAKLTPISIEERQFKKDFKAYFLKDSWDESGKPLLGNMEFMTLVMKSLIVIKNFACL